MWKETQWELSSAFPVGTMINHVSPIHKGSVCVCIGGGGGGGLYITNLLVGEVNRRRKKHIGKIFNPGHTILVYLYETIAHFGQYLKENIGHCTPTYKFATNIFKLINSV